MIHFFQGPMVLSFSFALDFLLSKPASFQAMKDAQVSHAEVVEFRQAGVMKTGDG